MENLNERVRGVTVTADDIRTQLRALREDATRIQGRITDIGNMLNELDLPPAKDYRCPQCQVRLRGPLSLAEHVHVSHGGPLPAHWAAAERAAGEAA